MLVSITTTHRPATDLGYLLGKHPERCQSFELAYGRARWPRWCRGARTPICWTSTMSRAGA